MTSQNTIRGRLGAITSRLGFISDTLKVSQEESLSSYSRIADADVAEETARLVASRMRVEAASTMLAKVNTSSSYVLSLLRG